MGGRFGRHSVMPHRLASGVELRQRRFQRREARVGDLRVVEGRVIGTPLDLDRDMVYDSPFMKRRKGENIVTVRAGDRTALYDFDRIRVVTGSAKEN